MHYCIIPLDRDILYVSRIFKNGDTKNHNDQELLDAWNKVIQNSAFDILKWCEHNVSSEWTHHIKLIRNFDIYKEDPFLVIGFESDRDYFAFKLKHGDKKEKC